MMAAPSRGRVQILLPPIPNHGDNAGVAVHVGLERQEGSMTTTIGLGVGGRAHGSIVKGGWS